MRSDLRPSTFDLRPTGGAMQDRPTSTELLAAVREFLQREIVPTLGDHRQKFRALIAANVLGVVERELAGEEERLRAEWARLGALLGGDADAPGAAPLTAEGCAQAAAAARALAPVPLDRVVISGLPRTVETARIVAGDRPLTPEVRPELREIEGGRLGDVAEGHIEALFTRAFV